MQMIGQKRREWKERSTDVREETDETGVQASKQETGDRRGGC